MALPWTPDEAYKAAQLLSRALKCSPESPGVIAADLNALFNEDDNNTESQAAIGNRCASLENLGSTTVPEVSNDEQKEETMMTSNADTADEDDNSSCETDADFRQSGRFMCLETGRRVEDGIELQSVSEELSTAEGDETDCFESECEEGTEEKENEEPNSAGSPLSATPTSPAATETSVESAMEKMAQYMQSTQAAAQRAADAQARVQKFLADKSQHSVSAPTLTKPRTPVVMKRDRFHKVVKSSEELQLEASLLAHAEWKLKVQQNKQALERERLSKNRNVSKHERLRQESKPTFPRKAWGPGNNVSAKNSTFATSAAAPKKKKKMKMAGVPLVQKRAVTVPREMGVLGHKGTGRKLESYAEREAREIAEARQRLSEQIEANRRFSARAQVSAQSCEVTYGTVHSTKPLTIPKTPKCTSRQPRKSTATAEAATHTSVQEMNKFNANMRRHSSAELTHAMASARGKPRVTIPKAPTFATDSVARAKPSVAAVEAVKVFVARPMPDYASLSGVGINTNVKPRPVTVPKSPTSNATARAHSTSSVCSEDDAASSTLSASFVARPMPDYGSLSNVGINTNVKHRPLTVPKSPSFHSHSSARPVAPTAPRREEIDEAELARQFKARPLPGQNSMMRASTGSMPPRPLTVPEPFNMPGDAIAHHRKSQTTEEKALEEIEEHQFKAKPVPDWGTTCFVPKHSGKELTVFDEFDCAASAGVVEHAQCLEQRRAQKLAEEQELLLRAAAFVAKPLPPTTYEPGFVPHPSERPPLVPLVDNVVVAGNERAKQRKVYNDVQKRRVESDAKKREDLVKQREQEADAAYEEQMGVPIEEGGLRFVALPLPGHVMKGPDFVPTPSSAELTVPETPMVLRHQKQGSGLMGGGAARVVSN